MPQNNPLSMKVDATAMGSDVARSRAQYLRRLIARAVTTLLGLNHAGDLATEIVQAINPVIPTPTARGILYFTGGHGRLLWRTRTFATEEPETITWLDTLSPRDVLWDVGANVGMYAIYAARLTGCRVFAFEPEAQNYAVLLRNIALNQVQERCHAASVAVAGENGLGYLNVRSITQGGAHNQFARSIDEDRDDSVAFVPDDPLAGTGKPIKQIIYGATLDSLSQDPKLDLPTHLKVDVDGLEGVLLHAGQKLLENPILRSVLVELNPKAKWDKEVPELMKRKGFQLVSERSNWESRKDRSMEAMYPATNMIFSR
ncbi:MAG: FkbM family methyltransferase [Magnetococcales bacterium]|nr:FkbM family methyltransferase [Magnetococcales bacterium]